MTFMGFLLTGGVADCFEISQEISSEALWSLGSILHEITRDMSSFQGRCINPDIVVLTELMKRI